MTTDLNDQIEKRHGCERPRRLLAAPITPRSLIGIAREAAAMAADNADDYRTTDQLRAIVTALDLIAEAGDCDQLTDKLEN